MIKVIIGDVKNLVIFYQVNSKKLCNKGLEIVEINL